MALEYERLTSDIEAMAQGAYQQRRQNDAYLEKMLAKLRAHRTAWEKIDRCVDLAVARADRKYYRGARPLTTDEPLDAAIDAPAPPHVATLVASDGSQILPNRHGPYLYSLINVGVLTYFHGRGAAPEQRTHPVLEYPNQELDADTFVDNAAIVSLRRDLAEIETLVDAARAYEGAADPVLALLDQRLLYWPVGSAGNEEGDRVLWGWQKALSAAADSRCLLAGYIDRPAKRSVLTLLDSLDIEEPDFKIETVEQRGHAPGLVDSNLFYRLLTAPGQRSAVFIDVSQHNDDFERRDARNRVCFFYLNPGQGRRQLARVDIPIWVAENPDNVAAVHGLVYNQCQIMGDYPYVLARADELAVISFQDKDNLEIMIENAMQRYGLAGFATAKQMSKDVARAGRTRHGGLGVVRR